MNAQSPCQLRLLAGWSTAGLSHQPTPRGRSATQLQQAVVPLWLKRMAMDNRFSRIAEVTSRGGFDAIRYRTADVDGFKVFYREAGPADAPKLLLLHGFPSAGHMFRDLIPLLADRFHIVAPDL